MKYLFSFLLLFFLTSLFSQISFKFVYNRADNSNVKDVFNKYYEYSDPIYQNNFGFGVNYRHQFDGTGFELLPGLLYETSIKNDIGFSMDRFSFELPFIVYPLNMEGDCGCPDFSIRNKFFEKHIFFILNPSIIYENKKGVVSEGAIESVLKSSNLYFKIGFGLGMSLPITESLSLAPAILYDWAFKDKWDKGFFNNGKLEFLENDVESYYTDFKFDLRINYKFGK